MQILKNWNGLKEHFCFEVESGHKERGGQDSPDKSLMPAQSVDSGGGKHRSVKGRICLHMLIIINASL